ncbi:MAG: carbohydrate-binding family 9-like protein [Polaribacter sp.]|uniref:carbohydrate-binding family 9-like protein n=1 Tax=Polaribacter sp. TaxID=1920175 RepID=UPI002F35EF3A
MKSVISTLLLVLLCANCSKNSNISIAVEDTIVTPKSYVVYKTNQAINIDGKPDELIWGKTTFTDDFIDIKGIKIPNQKTNVKMLWDTNFLYIYAKLFEKHIWGTLKKRDTIIFFNNDFEVFISPSNDTHNYGEIEVNALNTVWDLVLNKPYNVGGKPKTAWNLKKLQSKVHIKGTLNNAKDEDSFWAVEMAIPLDAFAELKNTPKTIPKNGEQWRVNFSRVQWNFDLNNGIYSRKKENNKLMPEYNWVWSNQGAINMHLPENWGYIQFSDNFPSEKINFIHKTDVLTEQITYALYRKIAFTNFKGLKLKPTGTEIHFKTITIKDKNISATFLKTYTGFNLKTINKATNIEYLISENGLLHRNKFHNSKK